MSAPSNTETKESILLLGMVFTELSKLISWKNTRLGVTTLDKPNRGQEFRDMVRCEGLESRGYDVRTLDNKHDKDRAVPTKHCQTSFCDARRMKMSMREAWGNKKFDAIILDYFFSPVGWARERWGDLFFSIALPMFVKEGFLTKSGCIILPNIQCVEESLQTFQNEIESYYYIEKISDPNDNPLYAASGLKNVKKDLMDCPDMLTNETQIRPLNQQYPFFKLVNRLEGKMTPQKDEKILAKIVGKRNLNKALFAGHDHNIISGSESGEDNEDDDDEDNIILSQSSTGSNDSFEISSSSSSYKKKSSTRRVTPIKKMAAKRGVKANACSSVAVKRARVL